MVIWSNTAFRPHDIALCSPPRHAAHLKRRVRASAFFLSSAWPLTAPVSRAFMTAIIVTVGATWYRFCDDMAARCARQAPPYAAAAVLRAPHPWILFPTLRRSCGIMFILLFIRRVPPLALLP